ncbi:MAG: thioredoxin-disulfide reductase [Candidatus Margulisiibacteriota bacterium]
MTPQVAAKTKPEAVIVSPSQSYDVVIIGGGPAGLTAAIYALRSRLKTLLIEKMVLGGLASTAFQIENYPGFIDSIPGMELCQRMEKQALQLGLEVLWGNVKKIDQQLQVEVGATKLSAKAIIIASGTEPAKLGVPGEDELRGRGVSYCATCDGPFYQGKNVVVVGGGNSAVEEALYLTRFAAKVSIVHRRDQLRADKIIAEKALNHPKIYLYWHAELAEIGGSGKVTEVTLQDKASGKKIKVPADGVFIYIGTNPNNEAVRGIVKLDERGFIITDDRMKTSATGIFAAGDIRSKHLRQIVTAAADGAIAADAAREFIEQA